MTTGRIGESLHFKETNLIQTTGEDVDDMTVVRNAFSQGIIKLFLLAFLATGISIDTHLQGLLIVLDVVSVNVMMRSNGLP